MSLTRVPAVRRSAPVGRPKSAPTARYLGHDGTGILAMRSAPLRDVKTDVRQAAGRSMALAWDFAQNNGWIAGGCDQVITDMVGTELKLNAKPAAGVLGYDEAERKALARLIEAEWRKWSWNPAECDAEGKATVPEMLDGTIRHYLVAGEDLAVIDYMSLAQQRRYGLETGTKVRKVAPHRLRPYTSAFEGWQDGIYHDENDRVQAYRFRRQVGGLEEDYDIPARAGPLARVLHVMDRGATPGANRGISPMAPAFMTIAQSDQLANATLTTALLQTAFAATINSPEPTDVVMQALETLGALDGSGGLEGGPAIAQDMLDIWGARMDSLRKHSLSVGGDASRVNHLGPGEELKLHGAVTPGPDYLPFKQDLMREIGRCMGLLFEALTLDHSSATYSSVRMGVATMWPLVERRRSRIAAPMAQGIYEAWLDEMVGTGRIPIRGGYAAFAANRQAMVDTEWRGPEKPTADPYKDALANRVELENGTTTRQRIIAGKGEDIAEIDEEIGRDVEAMAEMGVASPYGRRMGGEGNPATETAREGVQDA